jgi:predicted DNA-binding antitoxin AbrB/MazE fold protein
LIGDVGYNSFMTINIHAVYENGVLKLAEPLPLPEHQAVRLQIQPEEPLMTIPTVAEMEQLLDELATTEACDLRNVPDVLTREDFYGDRV